MDRLETASRELIKFIEDKYGIEKFDDYLCPYHRELAEAVAEIKEAQAKEALVDPYKKEYLYCEFFEEVEVGENFRLDGLPFTKIDEVSATADYNPCNPPHLVYGYNETTKILHFAYIDEEKEIA